METLSPHTPDGPSAPDGHPAPTRGARLREFLVDSFWLVVIALLAVYGFLLLLGGFSPTETVGASIAVAGCAVLFGLHMWRQHVHKSEILDDPRIKSARERRGF